jgi:hypothetical protein
MDALRIIGLCVLLAVAYGTLQDQVTARICLEYFTIGHPRLFAGDEPTLHALAWGVLATWWVGLLLGVGAAVAARAGARPPLGARDVLRPALVLLGVTGAAATLAGLAGWWAASHGQVVLVGPLAERVPPDRHVAFLTDLWAHVAAYAAGALGGPVLWWALWRRRGRRVAPA